MILHIPHSSTVVPEEVRPSFVISDDRLAHELLLMTDAFTDELFDHPGATRVVYPVSRLVVERELTQHGTALIIDCHSFPSVPHPCAMDKTPNRPAFCIGTDEFHSPRAIAESLHDAILRAGHSVHLNHPYSGTIVPGRFYHRDPRVRSVMIEVRRDLYMDEGTGCPLPSFNQVRDTIGYLASDVIRASKRTANTSREAPYPNEIP